MNTRLQQAVSKSRTQQVGSSGDSAREKLFQKCLAATVEHGLTEFSLRKLADKVGTSARMLVYHFGSAEALFLEIIREIVRQEGESFDRNLEQHGYGDSVGEFFKKFWYPAFDEKLEQMLILFAEVYSRTLRDRDKYDFFIEEMLFVRIDMVKRVLEKVFGLPKEDIEPYATLFVSVGRGIMFDLIASGDTARVKSSVEAFKKIVDHYYPPIAKD